jgi:hypothetical protein
MDNPKATNFQESQNRHHTAHITYVTNKKFVQPHVNPDACFLFGINFRFRAPLLQSSDIYFDYILPGADSKMELQFQTNWGPLTAVGVPFLDLKAAVELAVGAYGWWKARERAKSLELVLSSAGCELSHCSTFDRQIYCSRFAIL